MAALARDFSSWLQDGRGSDVTLCIVLDAVPQRLECGDGVAATADAAAADASAAPAAAMGGARSRCVLEEFAAHSLVLEEASGWAAAMLRSPESRESQERSLDIVVGDEEEGAIASLLVRMIYAGCPTTLLMEQPQLMLLQVLRLADRLQAPRCIAAAGAALVAVKTLERETLAAIWALPGGCADNAAYAAAFEAAAAAVQRQLGDLDASLADDSKREQLLALPFDALRRLLDDDDTRVSSESMVFWVAHAWLQAHGGGSEEQQRQLAAALRLHNMSPLYLTTVVSQWEWVTRHVAWQHAAAYAVGSMVVKEDMGEDECYPELCRPWRPASAVTECVVRWDVPLAALLSLYRGVAGDLEGCEKAIDSDTVAWWGGFSWKLRVTASHEAPGVEFGAYVMPAAPLPPRARNPVASARLEMCVRGSAVAMSSIPMVFAVASWGNRYGWPDFFGLGRLPAWDEGAWRAAGLVSEGGCVPLVATIGEME